MTKQILITGGLGFIGIHLIKRLITEGYFPIIIDNLSNANFSILKKLPSDRYAFFRVDINKKREILKKIEKYNPQALVHLAAVHYIPFCVKNPRETKNININGTKSMLYVAKEKGVKRFIFASSGAVYKPSFNAHRENERLSPIDVYGQSKKEAEKVVKEFCVKNNIRFTILRFFNIYGDHDLTPHFIPALLQRLLKSHKIRTGDLSTERDYIFIDDLVDAIMKVIKGSGVRSGTFNVGTGNSVSGWNVLKLIGEIKGFEISIQESARLKRKSDRKVLLADIKKISKVYAWKPKYSIRAGLSKLIYEK
jgi:UDP-glucose 4-epimerase